ncbi:MAG: UDP-galactopyranose mutase [Oscillospiraceae bacterium]
MEKTIAIVGAGFAGSLLARLLAENGMRVTVYERRGHIAGNMYDYTDENNIRIQKYGPHTFHTNLDHVYALLQRFTEFTPYRLKCEAVIDGIPTPSPFNFKTIDQFFEPDYAAFLKEKLTVRYPQGKATVLEMLECDDADIRAYAQFLFEKDYKLYTAKQWGKKPEEIDPSVLRRVPIVFNYNDTYFYDKYEGLPRAGFTALFENILDHPAITVRLNEDAMAHICIDDESGTVLFDGQAQPVVFTGAIDELFGWRFGRLPYRSLYFELERHDKKDYQNVAIVAHPADAAFTRITEYTKLPVQDVGNVTVIAKEYSVAFDRANSRGNEPYYPVLTEESRAMCQTYQEYARRFHNLILCGRLADFQYYNMDQVIDRTLTVFEAIKRQLSAE